MRPPLKLLSLISLVLILCLKLQGESEKDYLKKFTIFQTSDIHSHINNGTKPGWLDMAEMIKRERKQSGGKKNTLLIDCGDTIPGSIIGIISGGQAAISILNTMNYDASIPGNHDLEFGFQTLNKLAEECSADIIAANLHPDTGNNFIKWQLYHKNGIKIALLGVTSPHITEWLWGNKLKQYNIIKTNKAIDAAMGDILKADPDIIILAIHHGRYSPARLNGFNIKEIADKYPQIDLILGAHSHQEVPGEKCGIATWYVETGAHAEKFAKIEVTVDKKLGRVASITSKLIPVTKQKKISSEFTLSIKKWKDKAAKFAKNVIGKSDTQITAEMDNLRFSPMSKLFTLAIKERSKADFAFHGAVIKSAKFAGKITEADLFEVIPYEDTICLLKLTPAELKIIITEQMKNRKMGHFQSYSGFNIKFNYQNKMTLVSDNGKPLNPQKRFITAFSSYVLAGAGGRFPKLKEIAQKRSSEGVDTDIRVRDALRKYIQRHTPLIMQKFDK
jgi:2',3'-cyclic-nucleotide 2'-phosphodiesterase (5'-nucleotidase family)